MPTDLSADDLNLLLSEADAAARRLRRTLHLPHGDLADLRQDLLLDLIARLPGFDPRRGSLGAFANTVLRHRSTEIADRVLSDRRLFGEHPVSLDAPVAEDDVLTSLGDTIAESEGLSAWHGQPTDRIAEVERRIDVDRALGLVPSSSVRLCAGLAAKPADRVAADGPLSRATVRRRITELRHVLTAHGLQSA